MLPADRRGTGARTLAFVVALALTLVVAAPAGAKVKRYTLGDFQYAKDTSSIPFAGAGEATAGEVSPKCEKGWTLVGGGVRSKGLPGHGRMTGTGIAGNRRWFGTAVHGDEDKTKLLGYSICVHDRFADSASSLQSVPASSGSPVISNHTVSCPAGLSVLGGGVETIGDERFWGLNTFYPKDDATDGDSFPDDAWQAYVAYGGASPSSYLVQVICGEDLPAYESADAALPAPLSFTTAKATAMCGSGHVTGGGALISGAVDQAFMFGSYPIDGNDKNKAPDDGWRAQGLNTEGSAKTLTTYAACL